MEISMNIQMYTLEYSVKIKLFLIEVEWQRNLLFAVYRPKY